jgi:hypothetical protein
MNKVEFYASFISEQVYMDEIFGGRDRGYPYDKSEDPHNSDLDHMYHIHTGSVFPAVLSINHDENTKNADVSFVTAKDPSKVHHHVNDDTVETERREMTPEEKTTFINAYKQSLKKNPTEYSDHHFGLANHALYLKHNITLPYPHYETEQTPALAKHAIRLFSTIGDILKKHAKKYDVNNYEYTGEGKSRNALYNRIASRFGGKKGESSIPNDIGKSYTQYSIPAGLKKQK